MILAEFLIPVTELCDRDALARLHEHLTLVFGGYTRMGMAQGAWVGGDGNTIHDRSRVYHVGLGGVPESVLYDILADFARDIGEQSIWCTFLQVTGGCIPAATPIEREAIHA